MSAWEVPALIAWLRRIGPKVDSLGPFELLEMPALDDLEKVRLAYHGVAATRHPDLFRGRLGTAEAEMLMRVFSRISGAYAQLRDPEERRKHGAKKVPASKLATPPTGVPITGAGTTTPAGGIRKIAPRALSHVRRADSMLDAGDLGSAILHLRMAVAADPSSRELRQLLTDTEAKLKKK